MREFSLLGLIRRFKVIDVFTPSTVARLTYIKRSTVELDLDRNIQTPGMQIVLYGNSGCGKTTLVMNRLSALGRERIKTSCTSETTFDQLILSVFDKLGTFYTSEKSSTRTTAVTGGLQAKFLEIATSIGTTITEMSGDRNQRIVPIQLSPERLAEFLGAANCVWVIEDFHKISTTEKTKLSQVLKVFMDVAADYPKVKIICIGAVATARELIEYDRELSNRVSEIYVPLMSNPEIRQIVQTGFRLMNVRPRNPETIDKLVHFSNNLASVCHQLCLDICVSRKLDQSKVRTQFIDNDDFANAVKSYLRKASDTFLALYERITSRTILKDVMLEIIENDKELFGPEDILTKRKNMPEPDKEKLLDELCSVDMGELLRFNQYAKKYSISNPFFKAFLQMRFALDREESKKKRGTYTIGAYTDADIDVAIFTSMYDSMVRSWDSKADISFMTSFPIDTRKPIEQTRDFLKSKKR